MNIKGSCHVIGSYMYFMTAFLSIGLFVALYFQFLVPATTHLAPHAIQGFVITTILSMLTALVLRFIGRNNDRPLLLREAIFSVVTIWLITSIYGALPFTLNGTLEHFIDAWFESVSGITTTGSSILHAKAFDAAGHEILNSIICPGHVTASYFFYGTVQPVIDEKTGQVLLTGVEAIPQALIFWRSALHWYGGLGIILLFVAILPAFGAHAKTLFRYESTGPLFSPLFPKVRDTAIALLKIYVILTLANILALLLVTPNLSIFEAINVAFSTISTGGFSPRNTSIAAYNCPATEWVTMLFMFMGGVNFAIYYDITRGRFFRLFDTELVTFIGIILVLGFITSYKLVGTPVASLTTSETGATYNWTESLRYGYFQIVSCITNTGFSTANFDDWPELTQLLMLFVMFLGGMAGSTSGGLKTIRICILFLCARTAIVSLFRRSEVRIMRVGSREINKETIIGVLTFFLIMVISSLVGIFLLVGDNVDFETAVGLNGCMINNTGASFRGAGPLQSCAFLSPFSKLVCIAWMLVGRLEYYAWIAFFVPSFWRNK